MKKRYIESLREGEKVIESFLCRQRQSALTKAGKPYESLTLQDNSGSINAKVWDVNSIGIEEYDLLDYICVTADVISFQGALQLNVKRIRKLQSDEYDPADYLPISDEDIPSMYDKLCSYARQIHSSHLRSLAESFLSDPDFAARFKNHSAAKSVHHGFIGGLLEHTLHVTRLCDFFCDLYPYLNRDLLICAAIFHDVGKLDELSPFPSNEYTDKGQLLGHIVIGAMMIQKRIDKIDDFPEQTARELIHCILAHHGELEFGSPKKPALAEALALSFADNTDAKLESMKEALSSGMPGSTQWQGYSRIFETNIRRTSREEER